MPDPPLRIFSFLQCLAIFQFLATKLGQERHDGWLRSQGLPRRTSGTQYEPELYKGWFFWMYLNRLNPKEMKVRFNSQGRVGDTDRSGERWFRARLDAWSWPMPARDDMQARERFIEFILQVVPHSELNLQPNDPKTSRYITFPDYHPRDQRRTPWTLLQKRASQHPEARVSDLEQQAFALYNPDGPCQSVLTPRHCVTDAVSPESTNSSVITSPNACSPHSPSSSFTTMNPNTPSQVWSASSSPLPSSISAKKFSSMDIEGVGSEVFDPPPILSSGAVIDVAGTKLSEQLHSLPKTSTSDCHSIPSRDKAPRQLLTYGDGVQAPLSAQDLGSISQKPIQAINVGASDDHTEEGESNSSNDSVRSGTEVSDDCSLPDIVEDNSDDDDDAFQYVLKAATSDAIYNQSQ